MAKRGEHDHEDLETKEEREARVDEMLDRAQRAHRTAPKKPAPKKKVTASRQANKRNKR